MRRLARDVSAVVDAVEVDRLAVIVDPRTVGGRGEADHRRQRRPAVNVRHHFAIARASRNFAGCPHDAGHGNRPRTANFFLAAERNRTGVRPCILPRAIVGGDDDNGVGSVGPISSMILPMLESSSSMASE